MTLSTTRAALITLANRCDIPMLARRYRDLETSLARLPNKDGWIAENLRRAIAQTIKEIEQIRRDKVYRNPLAHLSGVRNRTTA